MIAASSPVQRPHDAKLLVVNANGEIQHRLRSSLVDLFRAGDLVVANDAATLPASLFGIHVRTGEKIEVRLAGRDSMRPERVTNFTAVVFGAGDYHTPTEHRPLPPTMQVGDLLQLGPLAAHVTAIFGHARLVQLQFDVEATEFWAAVARHGRPIQYSHVQAPLEMWDTWTPIAGPPVAFEPPSAGFALDWKTMAELRRRSVAFTTITHAAGISSTGDRDLDASLPFDEPYRIAAHAAMQINAAKEEGRRVIAVGTTVVRALEHSAAASGVVQAGDAIATQKIGPDSRLKVVDALLSGVHEPGTSHHRLLQAFIPSELLDKMDATLEAREYRSHEFGDSVFVERTYIWSDALRSFQQSTCTMCCKAT